MAKRDPLRFQIHYKIRAPRIKGKIVRPSRDLILEATRIWIETGDREGVKGITISGIEWENPKREHYEEATEDDPERIEEARNTLHLREILHKRGINFFRGSRHG